MTEAIYIRRLTLYLKSGTNLVLNFKTENPSVPEPQLENLKTLFGNPESQEEIVEFSGKGHVHVRIKEIAAFEVVPLLFIPTEKDEANKEDKAKAE